MSVSAYILIQADVGTAVDVATATAALDFVVSAEVAMGPYDVIARAQAATMDELGKIVVHAVQAISGVERTLLCPIVNV
ncbi:MAG: Lrp/AsnC ligand binding domain-containing protein [Acidimicrobiales bacterium]